MKLTYLKFGLFFLVLLLSANFSARSERPESSESFFELYSFNNNLIETILPNSLAIYIDEYLCYDCLLHFFNCFKKNKQQTKLMIITKSKGLRNFIFEKLKKEKLVKKIEITYLKESYRGQNSTNKLTFIKDLVKGRGAIFAAKDSIKVFNYSDIFDNNGFVKDCKFYLR